MRFWLIGLCLIVIGAAAPLLLYQPASADFSELMTSREKLLDEIEALENAKPLAAVHQSWHQARQYISLYEDLSLTLSDAEMLDEKMKSSAWHGVLSGDIEQLFAASRQLQNLIPVQFSYLSVEGGKDVSVGVLTLSVLGNLE